MRGFFIYMDIAQFISFVVLNWWEFPLKYRYYILFKKNWTNLLKCLIKSSFQSPSVICCINSITTHLIARSFNYWPTLRLNLHNPPQPLYGSISTSGRGACGVQIHVQHCFNVSRVGNLEVVNKCGFTHWSWSTLCNSKHHDLFMGIK